MAGEEAGSKLVRLVSFLGAGVICTAAINMWRDLERKSVQQTTQAPEKASNLVNKALDS
ncbi:hypothetical protein NE237_032269 [Protea cynaroides]|uniref:Uncharacterized protein n=1 Tax=Protea cynaroides TaxID=273540 RepID=A0A9Q0R3A8_9MAGN|nr:hypothetical protein NE237_032269 [Protea cynaroides]